jgi:alkanesulfonate monooxygenase SsuD/methylene tetrahydromethanopterin reductase-like flavin-dependent oxidoreductase (luciferase family)
MGAWRAATCRARPWPIRQNVAMETPTNDRQELKFGAQLWSQSSDWAGFRDTVLAAEQAGWDGVWTWDHLLAIQGPWEQPIFEGWSALAAVGALTKRVNVGLMVSANTFRNPGLTAKVATTLDHITNGRAVLGIGGAWFEREHDAFDIDFGKTVGERLDRLDEAVMLLRRLFDGERVTHEGRFYTMRDALCAPRPVQEHLPILVGGSGPKKTLRTVALRADAWNTSGFEDEVAGKVAILGEHCQAVGRDMNTIERTISFPILVRDDAAAAEEAFGALLKHNGLTEMTSVPILLGPPSIIAEALRPFLAMGFGHIMVRLPAPYDRETIERIGEVREAIAADRARTTVPTASR